MARSLQNLSFLQLSQKLVGLYAVFDYKGLNTDNSIFQYIFGTWLPGSDYVLDDRPHFEVLGHKYGVLDFLDSPDFYSADLDVGYADFDPAIPPPLSCFPSSCRRGFTASYRSLLSVILPFLSC